MDSYRVFSSNLITIKEQGSNTSPIIIGCEITVPGGMWRTARARG